MFLLFIVMMMMMMIIMFCTSPHLSSLSVYVCTHNVQGCCLNEHRRRCVLTLAVLRFPCLVFVASIDDLLISVVFGNLTLWLLDVTKQDKVFCF